MCGYLLIDDKEFNKEKAIVSLDKINHRGPDNSKNTIFDGIFFGFKRLSIQDLSVQGDQPMIKALNEKKIILMFNGEIYNFKDLKKNDPKISKVEFTSDSDTEVLINLYLHYGFEKMLEKIEGMFSICLYDEIKKKIFFARDHFGQKPLFYFHKNDKLIVSSEIKSITSYVSNLRPNFKGSLNPLFLQTISARPNTMIKDIKSLEPSHFLVYDLNNRTLSNKSYFSLEKMVSESYFNEISNISDSEYYNRLGHLLENSINKHLISDVPLGIAFSGGLDSSIIAKYATKISKDKLSLIKISNNLDKNNNENYFDAEINEIYENNISIEKNIPLVSYYSSGVGREDTLSLIEISKLAKSKGLKVLLTGDGFDELSGSYKRMTDFFVSDKFLQKKFSKGIFFRLRNKFPFLFNNNMFPQHNGYFDNGKNFNSELVFNHIFYNKDIIQDFNIYKNAYEFLEDTSERNYRAFVINDLINRFEIFLNRSDSYGMSQSVEIRTPILDINIVKFLLNSPTKKLVEVGFFKSKRKICFKNLAKKINISKNIINRKKIGTPNQINKQYYLKLIEKEKFNHLSQMLEVSPNKIRHSLKNTNSEHWRRDLFSFLSAECFFRTHLDNENLNSVIESYM